MNYKRIVAEIARTYGVTPQEVETQMEEAIWEAMQNDDPKAKELWKGMMSFGHILSVESFISYCAGLLKERMVS